MMSQLKQVDGRELSWSPQVDLRNCGVDMIKRAIAGLQEKFWEPWFDEYCRLKGHAQADLAVTAEKFTRAVVAYLQKPTGNLHDNLRDVGFFDEPLPCQLALFGRMGQVSLGHFAYAMGQSTMQPVAGTNVSALAVEPTLPYDEALRRLLDQGAAIADRLAAPPADRLDALGLGIQLLRPYARPGSLAFEHDYAYVAAPGVPEAVAARLRAAGWNDSEDVWALPQ